jgi:hypothetical protein
MSDLPISSLPLSTSGSPNSIMAMVNYDTISTGRTESIFFSALTEQFTSYLTTTITDDTTLTWEYNYYGVNNITPITLTLPTTSDKDGQSLIIKDEIGECSINTITIIPDTFGEQIDNENSIVMSINNMSLTFMVRNGNWFLI